MPAIAIFGGTGSGAIAAESVRALARTGQDIDLLGFLNDLEPAGTLISGTHVLGPFPSWKDLPANTLFLAPLHKVNVMRERLAVIEALQIPAERWATVIDPRCAVAEDADIAPGCFVGPFASVGPMSTLARHAVVRAGAHISHDCTIGTFAFIGINAVVSGFATLGEGGYVGPGAIVRERRRVGQFSVVGAGSVVRKDVVDGETVAGSPARRVAAGGSKASR